MKHMLWMVIGLAVLVAGCASNAEHNQQLIDESGIPDELWAVVVRDVYYIMESNDLADFRILSIHPPEDSETLRAAIGDQQGFENITELWCVSIEPKRSEWGDRINLILGYEANEPFGIVSYNETSWDTLCN